MLYGPPFPLPKRKNIGGPPSPFQFILHLLTLHFLYAIAGAFSYEDAGIDGRMNETVERNLANWTEVPFTGIQTDVFKGSLEQYIRLRAVPSQLRYADVRFCSVCFFSFNYFISTV